MKTNLKKSTFLLTIYNKTFNIAMLTLKKNLPLIPSPQEGEIYHLTEDELNRLTAEFQKWFEEKRGIVRARYWLVFLFLRYTGARISEILNIEESRDIDYRNSTVRLITLKRTGKKKGQYRIIPIPDRLISEYLRTIKLYPSLEGKVFKIERNNFFTVFKAICKKVGIPSEISHPHVLRHTRAIELLRSGIPVTAVQQLMGHASLNTTAMYLRYSNIEIQELMKSKGLI
ncbi:tyrosine-type recombinase/integrase [Thermodesulfovibrio yellowstonii]|uniref:Molybdenum-pterin-binding protein n=1 Tax=Thermodesulfovibrio yellowstonii TaxID=28262 RepID=A0A9W6GI47_9BACT|nr:site-specific integrase [Thermodesulfovibrio islandicus]GLI54472.1 molybdenum-pterin-binding protein [Thermodesulfovibrio islandicus]